MKTFQKWFTTAMTMLTCGLLAAETEPKATYSGLVVDSRGQPVANAKVEFYRYPTRMTSRSFDLEMQAQTTTDTKGAFSFAAPASMTIAVVKKTGFAPAWKTWNEPSSSPETITLSAPTTLSGLVTDENGQPVATANVWVSMISSSNDETVGWQQNYLYGKTARDLFSAQTSKEGRFIISDFPANAQASLVAAKAGKAFRLPSRSYNPSDMLPYNSGQSDARLVLDPAGGVEGKVTERETGRALAGVKLHVQPGPGVYMGSSIEPVTSGTDGSFHIADTAAGSYQLMAELDDKATSSLVADSIPVTVKTGEITRGVQVQAYKGGTLEVTVVAKENQKGLPNISVSAYRDGFQASAITGSNGVAVLTLPPAGQFNVYAMKSGRSQAQANAGVTVGQTSRIRLELAAPLTVTGIIRDASGSPVAGALVGVFPNYGGNNLESKSDASGHYEASWQPPTWAGMENQKYFLVARSLEKNLAAMNEIDKTTTNLDVSLKPGMTVSAQVEDPQGKAVVNTSGYLMIYHGDFGFSFGGRQLRADTQGHIEINALPRAERYGLNVTAKGYGSANQQMDTPDSNSERHEFPKFVLKLADRRLAGRVLGADGKPAAGAQVSIQNNQNENQPQGFSMTDSDGHFAFDAVCEGPISLWSNQQGLSGNITASGGDTNVVIRLRANNYAENTPSLTIAGTVLQPSGKPAVGVQVVVTPQWGTWNGTKTDEAGKYTIHWSAQRNGSDSKFFLIARDISANLAVAEEVTTSTTAIDLHLQPGLTLSGTVNDNSGKPLGIARINLNLRTGNTGGMVDQQSIQTDADGHFSIPGLPTNQRYGLYVSARGYGNASKEVPPADTKSGTVELSPMKLKLANLPLAGQVLGSDNKPFPGAYVMVNGQGQPNDNVRSDSTGHFSTKVCDGPLTLFAYNPQGGSANAQVEARGGDTNVVLKMGVRPAPRTAQGRSPQKPLKEQRWTWGAIIHWPANHKTGAIILGSAQIILLAGTGAGIFWTTRKRRH